MARKEARPAVGTWRCPMGGNALVYQTVKKGNHFYTHCSCCGLVQGTGQSRQQRIWDEAEFYKKADVVRPANVAIDVKPESEPSPSEPPTAEATPDNGLKDFDPSEPESEPESEKQAAPQAGGALKKLLPFGILFLAGAIGSWIN